MTSGDQLIPDGRSVYHRPIRLPSLLFAIAVVAAAASGAQFEPLGCLDPAEVDLAPWHAIDHNHAADVTDVRKVGLLR